MEDKILAQCLRYGTPVPEIIQNAPVLEPGLGFYYDAFAQLNTCRIMGGPISVNAIFQFGTLNDYTKDECVDMQYHIHRLDNAYLEHEAEKNKK